MTTRKHLLISLEKALTAEDIRRFYRLSKVAGNVTNIVTAQQRCGPWPERAQLTLSASNQSLDLVRRERHENQLQGCSFTMPCRWSN